jgi:hypothetical protein
MSCVGNSSITIPVMQVLNDDGAQLAVDAGQGGLSRRHMCFNLYA